MYYTVDDDNELQHHGILGQKWGVRRFQNKDGSLTTAGKYREKQSSSGESQNAGAKSGIDGSKLKKAAAIGAATAVSAALIAHPATRQALAKYGKIAIDNLPNAAGKVGEAVGKGAGKLAIKTGQRIDKVGDAMIDAALVSVGGIAISKLGDKLATDENASESQKNRNKVVLDAVTAGIKTATGSNGSSSSNGGNKGGSVGKEVTEKLGPPTKKGIDKQSSEWQELFKGQDAETRGTIKALAAQGYDMDQLHKYLGHSGIQEWIDSFIYEPARW